MGGGGICGEGQHFAGDISLRIWPPGNKMGQVHIWSANILCISQNLPRSSWNVFPKSYSLLTPPPKPPFSALSSSLTEQTAHASCPIRQCSSSYIPYLVAKPLSKGERCHCKTLGRLYQVRPWRKNSPVQCCSAVISTRKGTTTAHCW